MPSSKPEQGQSLADLYPEIAKEWHPDKNGNLKPTDVKPHSSKKVWWKCSKGHEWEAKVQNRVANRTGCPYCVAVGTSYPEQFLYWSLKQIFTCAINRFKTSNKVEYDIYIPSIRLAIEYSGKNWHEGKENQDLYKQKLARTSNVRLINIIETLDSVTPIYEKNRFEYNSTKNQEQSLKSIISLIIKDYNHSISEIDFEHVKQNAIEYSKGKIEYEKSLEHLYPEIAKEWHPTLNRDLKPTDVRPGNTKKVWWQCSKGHEWQAEPHSRTGVNKTGCPYCAIGVSKVITGENDLQALYPDLAKEWHLTLNGDIKPTDIRPGSNKKFWWKCSVCGHEWQASTNSRTNKQSGCPNCCNKRRGKNNK